MVNIDVLKCYFIKYPASMFENLFKNGIYVVHAINGYELHEKRVIELFAKNNLTFKFVTDGDPKYINQELIRKYFTKDIKNILTDGVLSCTLNHILAYEKMVENQQEFAIIFENDPFFLDNLTEKLKNIENEIIHLHKGFIISLENSTLRFPSYWDTVKNRHLYQAKKGRMAGAYMLDLKAATNILDSLKYKRCHTVIDAWHNSLIERGIIKMYWLHPALVEQGSHNGCLNSTISSKPKGVIRRVKWLIQKFYKMYFRRLFRENALL
jgi:glycosyl transferase, family 25